VLEAITLAAVFLASFVIGGLACWATLSAVFCASQTSRPKGQPCASGSPQGQLGTPVGNVESPGETAFCREQDTGSPPDVTGRKPAAVECNE